MGGSSFARMVLLALVTASTACTESPVDPASSLLSPTTPTASASRIDLGTLGGAQSFATDVNDLGVVVGWSETATGPQHAFRWTASQGMTDLGTLPGDAWSRAISISSTGQILGESGAANAFTGTPVVWRASGDAAPLPIPLVNGATFMIIGDRNVAGVVAGSALGGSLISHAWVWSKGRGTYDITAAISGGAFESYGNSINAFGVAAGTNHSRACTGPHATECWRPFVWSPSNGYRDLGIPPGTDSATAEATGSAINDAGMVVGWSSPDGGIRVEPYTWEDGAGFMVLPTFSADPVYGYAVALNARGVVVGASLDAEVGAIQAAAWPNAGGIVKLSGNDPNPGVAVAVNARGMVAGWEAQDCCGAGPIHATLWKLAPGSGAETATLSVSRPHRLSAARLGQMGGPSAVGCLADRRAMLSRQLLVECVAKAASGP